jgi:prophage antirepressor-like protein
MKVRTFNLKDKVITTLTDKSQKIWFVAKEVCKVLDYKNTSKVVDDHCIKDGITFGYSVDTLKRKQKAILIDEPNLYRLIMRSKQKNAIQFQNWVVEEVLPSIRKTGKYSIPEALKSKSTKDRNLLTDAWKEHGIKKPHHFIQLTLQEYKSLGFEKSKRKKDFSKSEILLLNALESMENLKLFHSDINEFDDCRESVKETSKTVKSIIKNKEINHD